MNSWEKLKIISGLIAAVIIPLVIAYIGNTYTSAIKERELQGKFVELAVAILREKPSQETNDLRTWATQVIDKYSGVPMSDEAKTELIDKTPLPKNTGLTNKDCEGPWESRPIGCQIN